MKLNSKIGPKNLVIIGGGFAGTKVAENLEATLSQEWTIYLLSKTNFVTYNPLLPEVVGASVLPGHVQAPLRQIVKRTRVRMVTIDRIDFEKRKVIYHNNEQGELAFDQLVIACGVGANMDLIEGLERYALPLKTVGDALYIRNRIVERLEQATIHHSRERRERLTSFIVIGGGFSGVEVAGEIQDFINSAEKYYKNVDRNTCQVTLIHNAECLLPEISNILGEKVANIFLKRGIEVLLNSRASRIESEKVVLSDGREIHGATIICTIGTSPHTFCQNESLPRQRGRIITQPDMSVKGFHGIWALGDCALVPNEYNSKLCPPTAQFAVAQANLVARNLVAKIEGRNTNAFNYKPVGTLAAIGHNKAVAEIYGIRITGFLAFLMWRAIYLVKVPTLSRKTRLFLEWSWAMFFPPDIAHLGFRRTGDK